MTARLYATADGPADAPVLVLGSSLGTTVEMWRPQVDALAESFRVIRYDHLGHGRSALPSEPCTVATLGEAVLRLLDDLGVQTVSYAGLSLGGMVGMWLGSHAPHRLDRLALLCTSALLGPAQGWLDRAAAVRAGGTVAVAGPVVARWFTTGFAAAHPQVVAEYTAMLTGIPAAGYAACCEAIAAMDLRADLPRIKAPTLVIAGAEDCATPVGHAEAIAEGVPYARLRMVRDAAHLANVEQPERVTRLLLDHFEAA